MNSFTIEDEFRSPRLLGAKYFLGNPIYSGETPKTPGSNKYKRKSDGRRVNRSYLNDITNKNEIMNYSSLQTNKGYSVPRNDRNGSTSNIHNSSQQIYKTYDVLGDEYKARQILAKKMK